MLNEVEEEFWSEIDFLTLVIFLPSEVAHSWKSPGRSIPVSASS